MKKSTYVFLDDRTRATGVGLVEVCTDGVDVVAGCDCVDVVELSAMTIGRGARGGVSYIGLSSVLTVDVCGSPLGRKPNIF